MNIKGSSDWREGTPLLIGLIIITTAEAEMWSMPESLGTKIVTTIEGTTVIGHITTCSSTSSTRRAAGDSERGAGMRAGGGPEAAEVTPLRETRVMKDIITPPFIIIIGSSGNIVGRGIIILIGVKGVSQELIKETIGGNMVLEEPITSSTINIIPTIIMTLTMANKPTTVPTKTNPLTLITINTLLR